MYVSSRGAVVQWRQASQPLATLAPRPRYGLRTRNGRSAVPLSYGTVNQTAISCGIGEAAADGLAVALAIETAIGGSIGTAQADGLAASIAASTAILCGIGAGVAEGLPASISGPTIIACAVAEAVASGLVVTIDMGIATVRASTSSRTRPNESTIARPAQRTGSGRPRQLS